MTKAPLLLLCLLSACSLAPAPLDSAISGDASHADAMTNDASVDTTLDAAGPGNDAGMLDDDAGSDAANVSDADVDAPTWPDAASDDSGAALDAGHDAAMFSGDAWTGVCGDGYIDPPETCDPGADHSAALACPVSGRGACEWCVVGRIGTTAGCVYGDYLYHSPPMTWSLSCRPSATEPLSWVVWHTAAERDAVIAAYRSLAAGGGTTNSSGWIGLHAASDTASFLWVDDGSALTSATILPFHNARSAGRNCVTLTVTDTDAYFTYSLCTGSTALCVTQPWGAAR